MQATTSAPRRSKDLAVPAAAGRDDHDDVVLYILDIALSSYGPHVVYWEVPAGTSNQARSGVTKGDFL
jgi:hypothetical protein